jgi:FtsZ-binding cell division protein ZapB
LKTYYDLVLEGPEEVIMGFVAGFIKGRGLEGEAVIIPEGHIEKRSGLGQILKLMHLKESESHLVAEQRLCTAIREAVNSEKEKIAIKVVSYTEIISASFDFTLKAFSHRTAEEIKRALEDVPDDVKLEYSKWQEEIRPDAREKEAYAPEHDYELHASGFVQGNPALIFTLHEKLEAIEMIEAGPIRLHHGKTILPV